MYMWHRESLATDVHRPLTLSAVLFEACNFVNQLAICTFWIWGWVTACHVRCLLRVCDQSANHTFNEWLPVCRRGTLSLHSKIWMDADFRTDFQIIGTSPVNFCILTFSEDKKECNKGCLLMWAPNKGYNFKKQTWTKFTFRYLSLRIAFWH